MRPRFPVSPLIIGIFFSLALGGFLLPIWLGVGWHVMDSLLGILIAMWAVVQGVVIAMTGIYLAVLWEARS